MINHAGLEGTWISTKQRLNFSVLKLNFSYLSSLLSFLVNSAHIFLTEQPGNKSAFLQEIYGQNLQEITKA